MVTGLGMVTPLALSRESSWERLLRGVTSARHLTAADVSHFGRLCELFKSTPAGAPINRGEVADRAAAAVMARIPKLADLFRQHFHHDCLNNMVALSLLEALEDARLDVDNLGQQRVGCVIGSSKASLEAMEREYDYFRRYGPTAINSNVSVAARWQHAFMPDATLGCVRFLTQSEGPSNCPVAACATGLISIIEAAHYIHRGLCDVCIAGSADASLRASVLAAFHRLGVLSRATEPQHACRPFDADRDGFVMGEGAAVVVLESRQHAERRRATHYGQVIAGGWMTDPTGMTQVDSRGGIISELVNRLIQWKTPQHVQLHGTGTKTNDLAEANGLNRVFGGDRVPHCSASKGATGHLLGAAGSVEFGFTLLSLRDHLNPCTASHFRTDPECHVPVARQTTAAPQLQAALKLSLGFGGHVAGCLVQAGVTR